MDSIRITSAVGAVRLYHNVHIAAASADSHSLTTLTLSSSLPVLPLQDTNVLDQTTLKPNNTKKPSTKKVSDSESIQCSNLPLGTVSSLWSLVKYDDELWAALDRRFPSLLPAD